MQLSKLRFAGALALTLALPACTEPVAPELETRTDKASSGAATAGQAPSASPQAIPQMDAAFAGRYHGIVDAVTDGAGNVHAVLVDRGNGGGVLPRFVYASYNGSAWSDATTVAEGAIRIAEPRVAIDGSGAIHFFWLQNLGGTDESKLTDVMHRKLGNGSWTAARSLYHEISMSKGVSTLALEAGTDANGNAFVVHYAEGPGPGARGLVTHIQNGDGFTELRDMNQGAYAIRIAEQTAAGIQVLVNYNEFIEPYIAGEPYTPANALTLRTIAGDGSVEKSIVHHTTAALNATAFTIDDRGARHVLWAEMTGPSTPSGAVFTLRYATSLDGKEWSQPVDLGPVSDYSDDVVQMTVDAAGTVHAVILSPQHSLEHMSLENGVWSNPRTLTASTHAQFQLTTTGGSPLVIWRSGNGYRFAVVD